MTGRKLHWNRFFQHTFQADETEPVSFACRRSRGRDCHGDLASPIGTAQSSGQQRRGQRLDDAEGQGERRQQSPVCPMRHGEVGGVIANGRRPQWVGEQFAAGRQGHTPRLSRALGAAQRHGNIHGEGVAGRIGQREGQVGVAHRGKLGRGAQDADQTNRSLNRFVAHGQGEGGCRRRCNRRAIFQIDVAGDGDRNRKRADRGRCDASGERNGAARLHDDLLIAHAQIDADKGWVGEGVDQGDMNVDAFAQTDGPGSEPGVPIHGDACHRNDCLGYAC